MRTILRLLRALAIAVQWAWLSLSLYQTVVTVWGRSRRPRRPETEERLPRFLLAVCARNEERVVASIVGDLLAQSYPHELFELVVFAHNCTDGTATVAERAGARVVRIDGTPGKAAVVRAALDAGARGHDYIGIFDADARVPHGFLEAVAAATPGEDCLQVESAPRDVHEWLVEGYGLGRRVRNSLWWRPRERLGLGTTITGSGWFIRPSVLAELLPGMHTLTEDLESDRTPLRFRPQGRIRELDVRRGAGAAAPRRFAGTADALGPRTPRRGCERVARDVPPRPGW